METLPLNIAMAIICTLGFLCVFLYFAYYFAKTDAEEARAEVERQESSKKEWSEECCRLEWEHESLLAFLDDNDIIVSRYEPRPGPEWVLKFRGEEVLHV